MIRLEFLGTAGASTIPRPACHCPVCDQARSLGSPYARTGPSIFIHGPDLLFDTPEESKLQLNRAGIDHIGACFYSHWHPDHTMGRRVFESLFLGKSGGRYHRPEPAPVDVYLAAQVAHDFDQRMGIAEHFGYMSERGWVHTHRLAEGQSTRFGDLRVLPIPLADRSVYAYLLEWNGRRVLIAMDELVGWAPPAWLRGLDLAVLPMGICEHDPFGDARWIPVDDPILKLEATFAQTLEMVSALQPRQVYFAHIEESDGLSYDDLLALQGDLRQQGFPATFAFDGLQVSLV